VSTSDPILWVTTNPGDMNNTHPRRTLRTQRPDGTVVVERVPQRCSDNNDYDNPSVKTNYKRWVRVVKQCGTEVRIPITNAAAHTDPNTGYAAHLREKCIAFGWYTYGKCPVAEILGGEHDRRAFISPEVLEAVAKGVACVPGTFSEAKPCPHCLAEKAARSARHLAEWKTREHAVLTEAEKQNVSTQKQTAEALQAIAAASQGNTEAMLSMMQAFMEKLSGVASAPTAPAKPSEKKPG